MAKENEIVIFETSDHSISLPVTLDSDTVWLNRTQMAELFGRDIKTIGKYIKNALHEELDKDSSVVAKFATTADTRNITISSACLVWHLCYHKSRGNHPPKSVRSGRLLSKEIGVISFFLIIIDCIHKLATTAAGSTTINSTPLRQL